VRLKVPIIAEIKNISSDDWDLSFLRDDSARLIGLRVDIGEVGKPEFDQYQVEVFNIAWLEENIEPGAWTWGRARMLLNEFDVDMIRSIITRKIRELGPYSSWPEFAHRLSPYLIWELEGLPYPPFPLLN
jgi:hypothetical protein